MLYFGGCSIHVNQYGLHRCSSNFTGLTLYLQSPQTNDDVAVDTSYSVGNIIKITITPTNSNITVKTKVSILACVKQTSEFCANFVLYILLCFHITPLSYGYE